MQGQIKMQFNKNLKRGIVVSKEDEYLLHKYLFSISTAGYPHLNIENKTVFLHSLVLPAEEFVDHINGNKKDCRRDNLRPATRAQNAQNRPVRSDSSSGYKGIRLTKAGTWVVKIRANNIRYHLGTYSTLERAVEVYNKAALEYHGEFAYTNNIKGNDHVQ